LAPTSGSVPQPVAQFQAGYPWGNGKKQRLAEVRCLASGGRIVRRLFQSCCTFLGVTEVRKSWLNKDFGPGRRRRKSISTNGGRVAEGRATWPSTMLFFPIQKAILMCQVRPFANKAGRWTGEWSCNLPHSLPSTKGTKRPRKGGGSGRAAARSAPVQRPLRCV